MDSNKPIIMAMLAIFAMSLLVNFIFGYLKIFPQLEQNSSVAVGLHVGQGCCGFGFFDEFLGYNKKNQCTYEHQNGCAHGMEILGGQVIHRSCCQLQEWMLFVLCLVRLSSGMPIMRIANLLHNLPLVM